MGLTDKQVKQLKDQLDNCQRPLYLFDDDQDGLCAFLQFYRYKQEGKGIIVKTIPKITTAFLPKVEEYSPDKVFVMDMAMIDQDFIDQCKVPIVWVDHHGPFERDGVTYFNPRKNKSDANYPTSYLAHQVVQQDLWLATLGTVADWVVPDYIEDFKKEYADLIDVNYKDAGDIIFNSKLGHLIRIVSFVLKGKVSEVNKAIKVMTRIKTPYEILNKETEQGKFIYKKFEAMNKIYEPLLEQALSNIQESKGVATFIYKDDKTSFTSDLSNELIYRYPNKTLIIGREKNGELKCSIRSAKILPPLVEKSLVGLQGYGGGHEHACGLNIKVEDFDIFVQRLNELV